MQGMRDIPDHLEAHENRQHENDEMLHEAGRSNQPHQQHQRTAHAQQGELLLGLCLEGRDFLRLFLFRGQFFDLRFLLRCNRLHLGRRRREGDLTLMGHSRAADHVIIHVVIDLPVLFRCQIGHHVANIGGVEG